MKKEKNFSERLRELIGDEDIKPFARRSGVEEKSIRLYLAGKAQPTMASLIKLAKAGGRPVGWLADGEGSEGASVGPGPETMVRIPHISWVQAGDWTEAVEHFQPGDAEEWLLVVGPVGKGTFALRVQGDSMEPEFREGDIVVVDPSVEPASGRYVIAKNGEGDATFKQIIMDGNSVYLKPLNDRYPIKDITGQATRIVGCVVQKLKLYR